MLWLVAAAALTLIPGLAAPPVTAAPAEAKVATAWVCPMLEHPEVFDKPGTCPRCGMKLVDRATLMHRTAAILVFDGVEVIDYAAPYEVLGQAGFQVFTVGPSTAPVTASMGQKLIPSYGFDDAPAAGVVVLPGGDLNTQDTRVIDWVRARTEKADVVLSVCNGAFWLAKAGLLDGLTATTFHRLIEGLQDAAPKCHVVRDRRFVDNGKIVTSAGLTSGMDGAIHVVDKLLGREKAREVALNLEYDWDPDSKYARANLADQYLPNVDLGPTTSFQRTRSLGDLDHWVVEGTLSTHESREATLARIAEQLRGRAKWTRAGDEGPTQAWSFTDERGRPWRAAVDLTAEADGEFHAAFRLERVP
jgi:putative intracellular protease/amidase